MNQQPLDFSARARATDPSTSHQAAAAITGAVPTINDRILEQLRARGPATSQELAERLGLSLVTVSPRMRPLAAKHLVIESGKCAGRTVWKAA